MNLLWSPNAWDEYLYWQKQDRKVLNRINKLINAICRMPFEGLGDPEALKHNLQGCWSRRMTLEHRLVYTVEKNVIRMVQCRYHY